MESKKKKRKLVPIGKVLQRSPFAMLQIPCISSIHFVLICALIIEKENKKRGSVSDTHYTNYFYLQCE